ncbi:MAG: hypothetical protein WCG50_18110 [Rhodoferax sp.]|uniref:hypothetical protein n=1 Tax=Rhodoferax sp. TaxID=50421 RepID=UPI00301ACD98
MTTARQFLHGSIGQVRNKARQVVDDSHAFLARNNEEISRLSARPQMRALDPTHCDSKLTEM